MPTNQAATPSGAEILSFNTLTQVQSDWSQSNPAEPSFIKNKPTIPEYNETVLYSGSRSANANLSETPVNFEYLRITLQYDTTKPKVVVLVDSTLGTQVVTYVKGVNTWTTYLQLTLTASAITTDNSKSISFGGINSSTPEIERVSLDSTEDIGSVVKVVGINRINSAS